MLAIGSTYHRPARALGASLAAALLALGPARAAHASDLVVSGAGWGHGVGMSQDGARGYAEHGWSYRAILAHYYSATAIAQVSPSTRIRVLIGKRVHRVALDTYVRGVVSAEMSASWPAAALEAQAVASRTYALTAHAGGSRFDVYSDTRSQVYRGKAAYTPQTDAAVAATAGQIVAYAGQPVITYFFASSGGRTENVENAWPGSAPAPWLRGVLDPYDVGPTHSWTVTITFATAAQRLGGLVRGSFEGIEVLRRGFSPRIVSAYVLGSGGRTAVSGEQLAWRLGLYGSWAYFSVRNGAQLTPEPDRSGGPSPVPAEPAAPPAPAAQTSARNGGTPAPA
jgi:stage II sporulation protein D